MARHLFACAHQSSSSQDKRASLIALPDLVWSQARAITELRYRPQRFTVFAVDDPKLREIFAPAFTDRLVQHWLVDHIQPWWDRRFIDDSFANRQGKGTLAAIDRLQTLMKRPGRRWYLQLDIQSFFPSIDRGLHLAWQKAIANFLHERLALTLHPRKQVLQRCNQGIDFLGNITFPTHRHVRQRIVRSLRRRLSAFEILIASGQAPKGKVAAGWQRWLELHTACAAPGVPSQALLQRMLSTINSYLGLLCHANTHRLRQHIYHEELKGLRQYFRPDGPGYQHLRIRKVWQAST